MRSMRYTVYTYCLTVANSGEVITLGSRDKYYFTPSRRDAHAELYLFRYNDGRTTKVDAHEYTILITQLSDCGGNADVNLKTGDIILGIASSHTPTDGGSGCIPWLYILRPLFKRDSTTIKNPINRRGCGGD